MQQIPLIYPFTKEQQALTQGLATTTMENIFNCERGRKTDEDKITSSDEKE